MSVIGIDFGNANCVIAQAKRGGVDVILNEGSGRKTPNLISINQNERFLGVAAVPQKRSNYKNTVAYAKRVLGLQFNSEDVTIERNFISFNDQLVERDDGTVGIKLKYDGQTTIFSTQSVAAMLLQKLMATAQAANKNRRGADVVLSVPGYWTAAQRRALLNAAEIAQLKVLRLVNDTTATALNYGIWKSAKGEFGDERSYVMFLDMGHSSFSVSIVAFQQGKLEVVASAYDKHLGGRNIDLALARRFAAEFAEKYNQDPFTNPKSLIKLMMAAEKTKITLTPHGVPAANCNVECLMGDYDFNGRLTLEQLEEECAPLLERLEAPIRQVLSKSGLSAGSLATIELVGGASRVPCFRRRISEILGLETSRQNFGLSTTMNADESVAMGCALQCAILSPLFSVKPFEVVDAVYYPVRFSWDAPEAAADSVQDMEVEGEAAAAGNTLVLFETGDGTPKTRRVTFRRSDAFDVIAKYDEESKAVEGLNAADLNLGQFRVSAPPPTADGAPSRIRLFARHTLNGLIQVTSAEYMQEKIEEAAPPPAPEVAAGDAPAAEGKAAEGTKAEEAAKAEEGKSTEDGAKTEESAKTEDKSAAEEAPAEKAEPKKKKYRRVNLPVEAVYPGMTVAQLADATEAELKMAQADRLVQETNDARNDLESYVYETRDALDMSLREFASEEERAALKAELEQTENWLYDDGAYSTKKVYVERLAALREKGQRIQFRQQAMNRRPDAEQLLSQRIEGYRTFANSTEEKYAHITEEERATVRTACDAAEAWLNAQREAQGALPIYADPVLTPDQLHSKARELDNACRPIKGKPAPKKEAPPADTTEGKTEEPAAEAAGAGDATKAENASKAAEPTEAPASPAPAATPATDMELD